MEKQKVSSAITGSSLVGINAKPPVDHGNYFWLNKGYVVNMWAENLQDLKDRKIIDDHIQCAVFPVIGGSNLLVVTDHRVPAEYLNRDLCFTGSGGATPELYKAIYDFYYPDMKYESCICEYGLSISWDSYFYGEQIKKGQCMICAKKHEANFNDGKESIVREVVK